MLVNSFRRAAKLKSYASRNPEGILSAPYGAPTEASLPSGGNPHLKYFVFWSGSIAI